MAASMQEFASGKANWRYGYAPQKRIWLRRPVELALFVALGAACAFAQAAVEYGGATAGVSAIGSGVSNVMNKVAFPSGPKGKPTVILSQPTAAGATKFINDSMISGSVEANRQALESRAGKDAGKLMLRSVPNRAYVRIDAKMVGRTPLLLVVPPGRYKLEMNGTRMEHAERQVDLLPRETREYSLTLTPRYPTEVVVQLH
jgi:PEGA domain